MDTVSRIGADTGHLTPAPLTLPLRLGVSKTVKLGTWNYQPKRRIVLGKAFTIAYHLIKNFFQKI